MSRSKNRVIYGVLLGCSLWLGACGTSLPPYAGGLAIEPVGLAPYSGDGGVHLGLPAGWTPVPLAPGDDDLKAQFKKEGTTATMQVYCQGMFVSRAGLSIKPLSQVNAATHGNGMRLWPDYSLANGAGFSAWSGTVAASGIEVPMNFYLAWKMPSGFGCKYGVFTVVSRADAAQIEGDFLAIARSLD